MLTVALVQLRLVIPTHQRTLMLILRGYGKINTRFAIATCFQDPRSEPGLVWVLLRRALGRWFCGVCGRYMFPRSGFLAILLLLRSSIQPQIYKTTECVEFRHNSAQKTLMTYLTTSQDSGTTLKDWIRITHNFRGTTMLLFHT